MTQVLESTKKQITISEFEKKVEVEAQNLMYFEFMKKEKAFEKAREYVSSKFETV